jgi:hypothetical protein
MTLAVALEHAMPPVVAFLRPVDVSAMYAVGVRAAFAMQHAWAVLIRRAQVDVDAYLAETGVCKHRSCVNVACLQADIQRLRDPPRSARTFLNILGAGRLVTANTIGRCAHEARHDISCGHGRLLDLQILRTGPCARPLARALALRAVNVLSSSGALERDVYCAVGLRVTRLCTGIRLPLPGGVVVVNFRG